MTAAVDGLGHWEYLALMGACLLITLPLEFVFSARVYRRLPLLLKALLPVVLVFAVWDIVAIARDHWTYDPRFVTGIDLGILPLEELVFFLVIPVCALLSYEAVGTVIGWVKRRTARRIEACHPTTAAHPTSADPHPPGGGDIR
ncbi:lycopene cyclase domain-containing protein [Brevibacterium atlanticum]|uniref:lycopene cyclase domain-containing protein n=1 Tax=Brevibacterium atlanticum TaxID=2697563 RepID=UPI00141E0256|nr:lycopene cyclase domain-containing protein [Brevibacterium atlanticum]